MSKGDWDLVGIIVLILTFPFWIQLAFMAAIPLAMVWIEIFKSHGLLITVLVILTTVALVVLLPRRRNSSSREIKRFLDGMKGRE